MPTKHIPRFTLNQMVAATVESHTSDSRADPVGHWYI